MCKLTQSLHVVDTDGTSVVGISAGVELLAVKLVKLKSYICRLSMYIPVGE